MSDEKSRNPFENFKVEIDPDRIDESVRNLTDRIGQLVEQSRHIKVRIKYKGKPLTGDIPLRYFAVAEVAGFWLGGILQALVFNLAGKAFLEIEFVHDAEGRVLEGQALFADGEVEAAEAKYREALKMKPGDTSAHYHLGVLLRVTGRRDEAVTNFEKAAANPTHPDGVKAQEALDRLNRPAKTL